MIENNKNCTIQYLNFKASDKLKKYCKKIIEDILRRSPSDSKIKLKVVKTNGGLYAVYSELRSTLGLLLHQESNDNKYTALNHVFSKLKQQLFFFKKNNKLINIKKNKN